MKFKKKFLKKVILSGICAGLIAGLHTVGFAEGKALINAVSDTENGAVIVSGRAYEQKEVNYTLLILKESLTHENLTALNFNDYVEFYIGGTTDSEGNFKVICLPKTEWSKNSQQIVFATDEKTAIMFTYLSEEMETAIINAVKDASESQIQKILLGETLISDKKFDEITGIDLSVYKGLLDKSSVNKALADASISSISDISNALLPAVEAQEKKEVLLRKIKAAKDEDMHELLFENKDYLGIKLDTEWGYKYLKSLYDANDKTPMSKLYEKIRGVHSLKELSDNFSEWEILYAVDGADQNTIYKILDAFKTELNITNLSELNGISNYRRVRVLSDMASYEFSELEQISKKFTEFLKNSAGSNSDSGSSSSNKGSGTSGTASANAVLPITKPEVKQSIKFNDFGDGHWANTAVSYLCENGVLNGYPDGSFKPDAPVKREEFIKMTVMALGFLKKDADCEFSDVSKDSWYYTYVASAFSAGLTQGQGEAFGAGKDITRQEAATMLYRAATVLEKALGNGREFKDHENIADYAKDAIFALGGSVISGDENENFNPDDKTTRAQAAQMLYKLLQIK